MSHRSTPKSPRSKSPSCQEDEQGESGNASRGRVIEEMRRQLEEELESSERLLSAADTLMSETIGSRNLSRPIGTQEGSRMYNASADRHSPGLRSGTRPPSGLEEDYALRLPSPPRSTSAYGSRGTSPGASQRAGSPYSAKSKQSNAVMPSGPEWEDALVGPDETVYMDIATSYISRDWASRGPSSRGPIGRGQSSLIGGSNMNYVTFESSRELSAENRSMRGTNPPSREAFGMPSAAGYSTCTGGTSRLTCTMPRPETYAEAGSLAPGVSTMSRFNYAGEEAPAGSMCKPGCRRYLDEMEKAGSKMKVEPSKASLPSGGPVPGSSDGTRQRFGQSLWSQQARPEHHGHHGAHGATFGRAQGGREGFTKDSQGNIAHAHHHRDEGLDEMIRRDDRATAALAHLSQLKKTPSYFMCGVNQGLEFLNVCYPKAGKQKQLPEIPCLQQEEINELVRCEKLDVESARYLASDERKTYKKPCPKQQKAQMNVKAIVNAHASQTCGVEKYTPLDHPEPEDITPEVAASMMFSQEQGIKMDACPRDTISHLFPDEPKAPFPEKVPRSTISIVDPNQKDREEMIEKSASVPSEGVSDSAYTRTMKEKGEELGAQKSYDVDFAIGQSKREYVLVAQKPQRFSKVQFRGGNLPSWFPGYFSAFPDEDGSMKSVSSPSGIFQKAWVHTNPRNIPTSDVIVLD